MAQRSEAVESYAYGSCIHYCMGLSITLVDSFSGWPEVIRVPEKKSSMIEQILRIIFSRNGITKTLVSDNAPDFYEDLNFWLEKIECKSYKTPPYYPQLNELAERMVQRTCFQSLFYTILI